MLLLLLLLLVKVGSHLNQIYRIVVCSVLTVGFKCEYCCMMHRIELGSDCSVSGTIHCSAHLLDAAAVRKSEFNFVVYVFNPATAKLRNSSTVGISLLASNVVAITKVVVITKVVAQCRSDGVWSYVIGWQ
jgi:hypothetical protein